MSEKCSSKCACPICNKILICKQANEIEKINKELTCIKKKCCKTPPYMFDPEGANNTRIKPRFNSGNTVSGNNSSISAGSKNTVSSTTSNISSGRYNVLSSGVDSIIGGGKYNSIFGSKAIIGAGCNNIIVNSYSGIISGKLNRISGSNSIIGAGINNTCAGSASAIITGLGNSIGANVQVQDRCVIAGGANNDINGQSSAIIVGDNNSLQGNFSFIGSGKNNKIDTGTGVNSGYSSIVGGRKNTVYANGAVICCGYSNFNGLNAKCSIIGAGRNNTILGEYNFIGGGTGNTVSCNNCAILNGSSNIISGTTTNNSSIVGGTCNTISISSRSGIISGSDNLIEAFNDLERDNIICGGTCNTISAGYRSSIIGGNSNYIESSKNSAIVNGKKNAITGRFSTYTHYNNIAGGQENLIESNVSNFVNNNLICAGFRNTVKDSINSICGGSGNTINSSITSTICGGTANTINMATNALIGCGYRNSVYGFNNCIIGGSCNTISLGTNSVICGGSCVQGKILIGGLCNNTLHCEGFKYVNNYMTSDKRLKKSIAYLTENDINVIDILKNIQPVHWQWNWQKDGDCKRHFGFIAQDLYQYIPTGPESCFPLVNTYATRIHKVGITGISGELCYYNLETMEVIDPIMHTIYTETGDSYYYVENLNKDSYSINPMGLKVLNYLISKKQQEFIETLQDQCQNLPTGLHSNAIVIGKGANVSETNSIAIGQNARINTGCTGGIAIGSGAICDVPRGIFFPRGIATLGGGTDCVWANADGGQLAPVASTQRVKKNIRDLEDMSHVFDQITPRRFEYKTDSTSDIGFIAEELYPLIPELVPLDEEGLPSSVKYSRLSVLLVQEIQKLRERVTQLESERNGVWG